MEKINYNELIDPLLIPIIRYLREEKGVDTMYCCQGSTREDKTRHHSRQGYIMAKYSPKAVTELLKIFNSHSSRYSYFWDKELLRVTSGVFRIEQHPREEKIVLVKLSRKIYPTLQELKEEWDLILSDITTQTQD